MHRLYVFVFIIICLSLGIVSASSVAAGPLPPPEQANQTGERSLSSSYYTRWLEEDVLYIITKEEKAVFLNLTTEEEREKFIEQFWVRRDPTSRTPHNEFKEEHYRRIAYANEHFSGGIPGWKSDRGRVYIVFGKPNEVQKHPGGPYVREHYEGGGETSAYPFEIWRYRRIDGFGDDIEIEFVDPTLSGEYRMAMGPNEKDALLTVSGMGLTMWEAMGLAEKKDRTFLSPAGAEQYLFLREKDMPFQRMERYFNLQLPPRIEFQDLRAVIDTKVTYTQLPCQMRTDFMRLSPTLTLVPITIEVRNENLRYNKEMDFHRAVLNVYGLVTSITGRVMAEFEHTIRSEFTNEHVDQGKTGRSIYQQIVALPPGQRYKLELVLKDVNSGNTGVISRALVVPTYTGEGLYTSSVILASEITPLNENTDRLEQFVLGDLKVEPKVTAEYRSGEVLIPYLQIYNAAIDQAKGEPSLHLTYTVSSNGKIVSEVEDVSGNTAHFFSSERVVVIGSFQLKSFAPGDYELKIKVVDRISNRSVVTQSSFTVQ